MCILHRRAFFNPHRPLSPPHPQPMGGPLLYIIPWGEVNEYTVNKAATRVRVLRAGDG